MLKYELDYARQMRDLLSKENAEYNERTGLTCYSQFAPDPIRVNLQEGLPLLKGKRVFLKGVYSELAWMLNGRSDVGYLRDNGVNIWNEWGNPKGDLGLVYGRVWRGKIHPELGHDNGSDLDQIAAVLNELVRDPSSRRAVVTAWHPGSLATHDVPESEVYSHIRAKGSPNEDGTWTQPLGALPACHAMFQLHMRRQRLIRSGYTLDMHVYQRSADWFLGVPFNFAFYGILLSMFAAAIGHIRGEVVSAKNLVFSYGNAHVYSNHLDACNEYLANVEKDEGEDAMRLNVDPAASARVLSGADLTMSPSEFHSQVMLEYTYATKSPIIRADVAP